MSPRPKPPNAGKGRKRGVPNKVTGEVKEMVLQALSNVGGVTYLEHCACDEKTRTAFLALVGKVLPLQIGASDGLKKLVIEWQQEPSEG